MKFLRQLWDIIWRASITFVIAMSGIYILSRIFIETKPPEFAIWFLIFVYSVVVIGSIYKINLHDTIKDMWAKRKSKNIKV
jgi:hypothetical protein